METKHNNLKLQNNENYLKLQNKEQDLKYAKKYTKDANKLINGWYILKSKQERYEEAIVLFTSASKIYKKYEMCQCAIDVLLLVVNIHQKMKETHEECLVLTDIARLYKKIDTNKSVDFFTEAIEKNINNGKLALNAALWKEIGEILENNIDHKNFTKHADRVIRSYINWQQLIVARYKHVCYVPRH